MSPGRGRVWILSNRYGNSFYLLAPVDSLFSVNSRSSHLVAGIDEVVVFGEC